MAQFVRMLVLFGFVLGIATPSIEGQVDQDQLTKLEEEVGREYNRTIDYFHTAEQTVLHHADKFELTENQLAEFQKLLTERNLLGQELMNLHAYKRDRSSRIDALIDIQAEIGKLADKLDNEILLPDQVKFLKMREFERTMIIANGNLIEVMKSAYGEDLELTEEQQKEADAAYKERMKEAQKAREAYTKKLQEIDLKYRKQISDSLSVGQKAIIEKHSGKPIVSAN